MKKKFNFIDVFIIVCLALILIGAVARLFIAGEFREKTTAEYYLVLCQKDSDPKAANSVSVDDIVKLREDSEPIGNVVGKSYDENKKTLTVIVKVKGSVTEDGFMLGGEDFLCVGMTLDICTEWYSSELTVMGITDKKM